MKDLGFFLFQALLSNKAINLRIVLQITIANYWHIFYKRICMQLCDLDYVYMVPDEFEIVPTFKTVLSGPQTEALEYR
jgi:hypothetical protein